MGIQTGANFSFRGPEALDDRQNGRTKEELKNWDFEKVPIPNGHILYCKDDKQFYVYEVSNETLESTGKFHPIIAGEFSPDVNTSPSSKLLLENTFHWDLSAKFPTGGIDGQVYYDKAKAVEVINEKAPAGLIKRGFIVSYQTKPINTIQYVNSIVFMAGDTNSVNAWKDEVVDDVQLLDSKAFSQKGTIIESLKNIITNSELFLYKEKDFSLTQYTAKSIGFIIDFKVKKPLSDKFYTIYQVDIGFSETDKLYIGTTSELGGVYTHYLTVEIPKDTNEIVGTKDSSEFYITIDRNKASDTRIFYDAMGIYFNPTHYIFKETVVEAKNIHNNLEIGGDSQELKVVSGEYGEPYANYSTVLSDADNRYIGVEYVSDENLSSTDYYRKLCSVAKGDDYIEIGIKTMPAIPFVAKQYSFVFPKNSTGTIPSYADFNTEYPMLQCQSYHLLKTMVSGTLTEYKYPTRNLRDYNPFWGKSAFMIQYIPTEIETNDVDSDVVQNTLTANPFRVAIDGSGLRIYNGVDRNYYFDFISYSSVYALCTALKYWADNTPDFKFEIGNLYANRNDNPLNRASNTLMPMDVPLVSDYLFETKKIKDSYPAYFNYLKDESKHTIELVTEGEDTYIALDGLMPDDYLTVPGVSDIFKGGTLKLGDSFNGVRTTFTNLTITNDNTLGDVEVGKQDIYVKNAYIASKLNPRFVGVMWHDIIPSLRIGRDTRWIDVPKNMRADFEDVKGTKSSGAPMLYYNVPSSFEVADFKSTLVDLGSGRWRGETKDELVVEGTKYSTGENGDGTPQILLVDTLISGEWNTATVPTKGYLGKISRVGADVCHTTAMIEQLANICKKNGYKWITWRDMIAIRNGDKEMTSNKYLMPQLDDYAIYAYTIEGIRKVFDRNGIPISVAFELYYAPTESDIEYVSEVCRQMKQDGHEVVTHAPRNYNPDYVQYNTSKTMYLGITEAIKDSSAMNIEGVIWDQSANRSTPNSILMQQWLGIKGCIATQGVSTVRATHPLYLARTGCNAHHINAEYPVF